MCDFLACVALFLGEEFESSLDYRVDLVLEGVAEAAFFSHELVVEVAEAVPEGAVVLGQVDAVSFGENDGGQCTFCNAEVVVAGCCLCFVGGDETLGHEESDFFGGLGDWDVLCGEVWEELGVEEVSAAREDGSSLVHAARVRGLVDRIP